MMTPEAYRAAIATLGLSQQAAAEFLFRSQPDPNSGCWLWDGLVNELGYGRVTIGRKDYKAHRVSWSIENGRIPASSEFVCHRCDTPACINPQHLFLGSHASNMADMKKKGRAAILSGSRCGKARLSASDVREIRMSDRSHAELGRKYGVTGEAIRSVRIGKTWRND